MCPTVSADLSGRRSKRRCSARRCSGLSARRGKFPFLQDLGSRLDPLGQEKPPARQMVARQYCIEALQGLDVAVVGTSS